jgi:hypothetical protein
MCSCYALRVLHYVFYITYTTLRCVLSHLIPIIYFYYHTSLTLFLISHFSSLSFLTSHFPFLKSVYHFLRLCPIPKYSGSVRSCNASKTFGLASASPIPISEMDSNRRFPLRACFWKKSTFFWRFFFSVFFNFFFVVFLFYSGKTSVLKYSVRNTAKYHLRHVKRKMFHQSGYRLQY